MTIKIYPTVFEAYDAEDGIFTVKAFDEATAEVHITSVVNVALWDEISAKVRECLVQMELT